MSGARRRDRVREPRRRPLPVLVLAGALLLGATGGVGTLAYWNDVETVSGGTVRAGSLDLQVQGVQGPYTWDVLQASDLAPGESVAAELSVRNAGTTPFDLDVHSETTGVLAPYVTVTIAVGGAATSDDTYPRSETCAGGKGTIGRLDPGGTTTLCVVLSLDPRAPNEAQGAAFVPTFTLTATQVQP